MQKQCNILVYGGGAVGSILGWRLAQHGQNHVSVVCRSNYDAVLNAGYTLRTRAWGGGRFLPHEVYSADFLSRHSPRQYFKYIICAQKITSDFSTTIRDLRSVVRPETTLVSTQNGMDVELPLRRAFPENTIFSSICNIGCSQVRPGYIEQTAGINPHAFLIGVYGQSRNGYHIDCRERDDFTAMDLKFKSIDCVTRERWKKLVFNAAWNSTTALTGLDTHQLLQHHGATEVVFQLASEAYEIATRSGVALEPDYPATVVTTPIKVPPIIPSTLQDARNGRPMELEPIFGYLATQATKVGYHAPYLNTVLDILRQMNENFMSRSSASTTSQDGAALLGKLLSQSATPELGAPARLLTVA